MYSSQTRVKTINSSLTGRRSKRSSPVLFYLGFLFVAMIGFMGVVFYKLSERGTPVSAAEAGGAALTQTKNNNNKNVRKTLETITGQQQKDAQKDNLNNDNVLKKAQEENLKLFEQNIAVDEEKAVENEWEMLERRAAEDRVKAKASEEAQWQANGSKNRWDHSKTIPQWLKEYFVWHNEQRAKIDETNWRDYRYIVLTCLHDQECGNVLHRLRPILGHLRAAHDSKRVLLIHWDEPNRLEYYVEPPHHGGIDWIVPFYMMRGVRKVGTQVEMKIIEEQASHADRVIVNSKFFDDSFAEDIWNSRLKENEVKADRAFHDVWKVLFKPTFMLQERITESLNLLGLSEGEYAAAHIDYDIEPYDDNEAADLKARVENAMNCLSQIAPGGPWFIAAQTYDIARVARAYAKQKRIEQVHAKQISHESNKNPTDLFTSFVEIYFMANANCVAYNRGGYGQMGYILGFDYNCRVKYSKNKKCEWRDPDPKRLRV